MPILLQLYQSQNVYPQSHPFSRPRTLFLSPAFVPPVTGRSHSACDSIRFLVKNARRILLLSICPAPARDPLRTSNGDPELWAGHLDASQRVPLLSLASGSRFGAPATPPQTSRGETHENVPGK